MKTETKIKLIRDRIKREQTHFEVTKERLEKQLEPLYEELAKIKVGDKVKVAQITVRDIHRDSDIEILGKTGVVRKVESGWITVNIDGFGYGFGVGSRSLEKI